MSKELSDQSVITVQDDDFEDLSSVVADNNDTISLYNAEKTANTILDQFFDEIKSYDDGTKSAKCLLCRTIVKQSTTSTYNYGRHVQRKHTKEMDQWKIKLETKVSSTDKKQPTIRQSFGQPGKLCLNHIEQEYISIFVVHQKYGPHNLRQLELTQMIVQDLIIDLGLPLSIVDHPAFLRAMNTVDPRFSVLSRRVLCRETLPSALEQVMMKVKQACSDAKFVALTLDVWTDRRMRAFIGTTMHTISETDDTFQNYLLTFQPLSGKLLSSTILH